MFCLFHFPDGGGSMFVHGLDLLGPAGDNPHVIGTGMEKRSETLCHQFLLKSHLDIFVIHPHYFFYFLFYFYFIYFFINCALVYINFFCLFAFVIDLFTTTNITLCIYLNNNIFIFYTWTCLLYKINFKKLKTNGFVMNG